MKKIAILLLLFAISLFANIGKVSAFSGDVKIDRNAKLLNATVGFILEQKDTVKTSDNAKAQIVFEDGTVVSIGKNAILNINEFVNDTSNPKNSKVDVKFAEGAFKTITGGIGKVAPDRFKLQTKSASIGIRGTIVYGDQSMIACTQGEIEVEAGGVRQILPAGTMTKIQSDGTPTDPEPIENDELGDIELDVEGADDTPNTDGTNPDDDIEIEPLPTEGDGQQPLSDTPKPTLDNTQNTDGISQTVNSDTTNDKLQNKINDVGNTQTLPNPFSFHGIGKRIEFQSGSLGYWNTDSDVNITPTSFDSNGKIIGDLIATDMNTTTLGFNEGDDVYWGYWNSPTYTNSMDVPWITGITTSDLLIGNTSSIISFSGSVMGKVYSEGTSTYSDILQNSYNSFTATINFGAGTNNMTGAIQFQDDFGNNWNGTFTNSVSSSSFSGSIYVGGGAGPVPGPGGGPASPSGEGNFEGNIYGEDEIKAIGGGFYMFGSVSGTTYKANGVFKAGVQE